MALLTQAGSHGSRRIPIYPGVRNIRFVSGARSLTPPAGGAGHATLLEPWPRIDLDIRPMLTVAFAGEPVATVRIVFDVLEEAHSPPVLSSDRSLSFYSTEISATTEAADATHVRKSAAEERHGVSLSHSCLGTSA